MRHYFITGATGVVGSALLEKILTRMAQVTILIRADTEASAHDRMKSVVGHCAIPAHAARFIRVIRGDLCRPHLGVSTSDYRHLTNSCTHIIHCAGNVHMNLSLAEARRQTLSMTNGVLELMAASDAAKKMEFVSTVGVAGRMRGKLSETWCNHPRTFHNSYEAAKSESEQLVREGMASGLPITVHRPSMVVGNSRTGKTIAFQVFYYLCEFICGGHSHGILPRFNGMRLDIIPSDYVAALLEASSLTGDSHGPILHSCSGRTGSIELASLVEKVRKCFVQSGRRLPPVRFLPVPLFKMALAVMKPLLPPKRKRALGALPYFLSYLEEKQYFDNTMTKQFSQSNDIDLPKVDEYLEKVLQYYLSTCHKRHSV